jgi:hypothetical protein
MPVTGPGTRRAWPSPTGHAPAANTKATITVPAAGNDTRNVCTGLTVTLAAGAVAPSAATVKVALIDGVAGATTYLWGPHTLAIAAIAGALNGISRGGRWTGSENTAMTLEFEAASGANTIQSVSMEGHTEQG